MLAVGSCGGGGGQWEVVWAPYGAYRESGVKVRVFRRIRIASQKSQSLKSALSPTLIRLVEKNLKNPESHIQLYIFSSSPRSMALYYYYYYSLSLWGIIEIFEIMLSGVGLSGGERNDKKQGIP